MQLPDRRSTATDAVSLAQTAHRLATSANLSDVYLIPSHDLPRNDWLRPPKDFGQRLGSLASNIVAQEIANYIALSTDPVFRIGVAGGSAMQGLFSSFVFPTDVPFPQVDITPLVVGPIPETLYSAGSVAGILAAKLPKADVKSVSVLKPFDQDPKHRCFEIAISEHVCEWRSRAIEGNRFFDFHWVVTGVGSIESGQLKAHLHSLYPPGKTPQGVVGDICSRLFRSEGTEIDSARGDTFVAITLDCLNKLATMRDRRVVAIAGGRDKVRALVALLKRAKRDEKQRLFNVLITDELTAKQVLRELV